MNTDSVEERLARIEALLPHLATKADIAEVKALISDREAIMLKWLIGITTTTAVSLLMVLVSLVMIFLRLFT